MSTYSTGSDDGYPAIVRRDTELVAVVVNGDQALAERICVLLNGPPYPPRCTFERGVRGCMCEPWPDCRNTVPADSCTCEYRPNGGTDPNCPVHHGRRARGPKPPPVGPGCICDGSGRTCPRHGAVI